MRQHLQEKHFIDPFKNEVKELIQRCNNLYNKTFYQPILEQNHRINTFKTDFKSLKYAHLDNQLKK